MRKLVVTLSEDRAVEGTIHLEEDGKVQAGPFPVSGRSDATAAQRHGNPARNPLLPYGDTPFGSYRLIGLLPSGHGTSLPAKFFGPHDVLVLSPTGGDAALADANGRFQILIQGGKTGPKGLLLPTNGSLRLGDKDQKKLIRAIRLGGSTECECEVRVGEGTGRPVALSLSYEIGDPLKGSALEDLRKLVMTSVFVLGSSWSLLHSFKPPIFQYMNSSLRGADQVLIQRTFRSRSGDQVTPPGGDDPILMAGATGGDGYSSSGETQGQNGSSSENDNGGSGSSGLNNAPTYHEDQGSGLNNAPTNDGQDTGAANGDENAKQQLEQNANSSQNAAQNPSDEGAKEESGQGFDTKNEEVPVQAGGVSSGNGDEENFGKPDDNANDLGTSIEGSKQGQEGATEEGNDQETEQGQEAVSSGTGEEEGNGEGTEQEQQQLAPFDEPTTGDTQDIAPPAEDEPQYEEEQPATEEGPADEPATWDDNEPVSEESQSEPVTVTQSSGSSMAIAAASAAAGAVAGATAMEVYNHYQSTQNQTTTNTSSTVANTNVNSGSAFSLAQPVQPASSGSKTPANWGVGLVPVAASAIKASFSGNKSHVSPAKVNGFFSKLDRYTGQTAAPKPAAATPGKTGAVANPNFAPGTALMIPLGSIKVEWALPPSNAIDPGRWASAEFLADGKENCWLRWNGLFTSPGKGLAFQADQGVDDYAWISNGDLMVSSNGQLGTLQKTSKFSAGDKTLPQLAFKGLVKLPVQSALLSSAGSNSLYFWGTDPDTSKSEVYLLKPKAKGMKRLFTTEGQVAAVAGNGEQTFVAVGKLVLEVTSKKGKLTVKPFYEGSEPVQNLCFSRFVGLFVSTQSGITYVDGKRKSGILLVKTPNPQMDLKGDDLFVFLTSIQGVLKLEGVKSLQKLSPP